jgi:AraC-like DNA-binding protein
MGAPPGIDTLSDVLRAVRLTGAMFFLIDASSPWVAEAPSGAELGPVLLPGAQALISYHLIAEGAGWCFLPGGEAVAMEAGDVVVLPHGDAYGLSSAPGMRAELPAHDALGWFRAMAAGQLPPLVEEGGGGPRSLRVLCGFLGCDLVPFNPVLGALPRLLHVRRSAAPDDDPLRRLLAVVMSECAERRPGGECVLLRLGELIFVEVVRRYLAEAPSGQTGWLAGLRDPFVGRALALLHERPAEAWTLERLSAAVSLSRSALADRFVHFIGQPPMQYLARWRMQIAARLLADRATKVSAVAFAVGYESEAAFSRAFKRATGASPATWRRQRSPLVAAAD